MLPSTTFSDFLFHGSNSMQFHTKFKQTVIPDMTFTVGFCCEGKLADEALERSFSIVSSQVSVQGAAVSTGVWTLVALVRRSPNMQ